jgi:cation diffusion facilitator CzcD-associated flavoprotein CzcO
VSQGLERLREQVARELLLLNYPARAWVPKLHTSFGAPIYDVLIVGAGQGGLATAFGLLRERVDNILVVDQNPLDRAGPWLSFARMHTLRTPKYLTGPDLGVPSLTPRAYYEAQFGAGSWESLNYLPRIQWADYLRWYREALALPVQPDTRVGALSWAPEERAFRVPCTRAGSSAQETLWARRVVLATGIDGSGAWLVPASIRESLPEALYAHSAQDIDFARLAGKSVAVLGAGASAFDNAATALEHGAREVRLFFRRAELVHVNAYRWAEFVGFLKHFGDLSDAQKWRFVRQIARMGQLPPRDTFKRAQELPGFQLLPDTQRFSCTTPGDRDHIRIATNHGAYQADFLIVGTGFVTDLKLRPELALLESEIARWSERYDPPAAEAHEDLARHPYLGSHFQFTERIAGSAPYLGNLFNFTFGGLLSLGFGGASISGMKYAIARLVHGLTRSLFLEDAEHHYQGLCNFAEREL